jgi:hypothetical protein
MRRFAAGAPVDAPPPAITDFPPTRPSQGVRGDYPSGGSRATPWQGPGRCPGKVRDSAPVKIVEVPRLARYFREKAQAKRRRTVGSGEWGLSPGSGMGMA